MGSVVSCISSTAATATTAKVITLGGVLVQYNSSLRVSDIVGGGDSFLCDSDDIYSGDIIPAMQGSEYLELGHLYFVLPNSKLRYPLRDSEMAELAVRASGALNSVTGKRRWRRRPSQIAPAMVEKIDHQRNEKDLNDADRCYKDQDGDSRVVQKKNVGLMMRCSSLRHLRKVRESFRPSLSTIQEAIE